MAAISAGIAAFVHSGPIFRPDCFPVPSGWTRGTLKSFTSGLRKFLCYAAFSFCAGNFGRKLSINREFIGKKLYRRS